MLRQRAKPTFTSRRSIHSCQESSKRSIEQIELDIYITRRLTIFLFHSEREKVIQEWTTEHDVTFWSLLFPVVHLSVVPGGHFRTFHRPVVSKSCISPWWKPNVLRRIINWSCRSLSSDGTQVSRLPVHLGRERIPRVEKKSVACFH